MKTETILQKLNALETELKQIGLWTDTSPSPEQLNSREPFCVDCMAFETWVQWIFIPKLRAMLSMPNFNGLAHQSDIHTMAEHVFKDYSENTEQTIALIKDIDQCLNTFTQPTLH